MAVDQLDVVDFVSTAPNGDILLIVSDHLEWDVANEHLLILQGKLNRYLAFYEAGELVEKYPAAHGKHVIIKVYFLHAPSVDGLKFLELAGKTIDNAGLGFEYKQHLD